MPPPDLTVCPSLDVIGSLRLAGCMPPWDHPASIVFTEEDFATVRAGSVVTKVIVLERPETAVPIATTCATPFELTIPPNRDPMLEAEQHGRPLVLLQMGDNQFNPQELAAIGTPGTVLLPGDTMMPPPRDLPCLPAMCWPLVDPRSCLPAPENEICFHDGGDGGLPVGQLADGKLVGLDPADTVAQYIDSCGRPKIAVSNKVCLCVPRYILIRNAINPSSNTTSIFTGDTRIARALPNRSWKRSPWITIKVSTWPPCRAVKKPVLWSTSSKPRSWAAAKASSSMPMLKARAHYRHVCATGNRGV